MVCSRGRRPVSVEVRGRQESGRDGADATVTAAPAACAGAPLLRVSGAPPAPGGDGHRAEPGECELNRGVVDCWRDAMGRSAVQSLETGGGVIWHAMAI